MDADIKTYFLKHHDIEKKRLDQIDWEAMEKGSTTKHEISYKKTMHNLRNTMSVNHKWGRIESDACPLCTSAPETMIHLMSCPQQDISMERKRLIKRFSQTLSKVNTSPEISDH